jgi:nucleotide-binding universal stress UspA family protein
VLPQSRIERFLTDGQQSLARFGVPAKTVIRSGGLLPAVQEEMQNEQHDLVVLGAPLPDRHGQVDLAVNRSERSFQRLKTARS